MTNLNGIDAKIGLASTGSICLGLASAAATAIIIFRVCTGSLPMDNLILAGAPGFFAVFLPTVGLVGWGYLIAKATGIFDAVVKHKLEQETKARVDDATLQRHRSLRDEGNRTFTNQDL